MTSKTQQRHQNFINQYFLKGLNGTDAYMAVYPKASYNTARANAAKLLADTSIKAEIEARLEEMKMSADEALLRLADIARADMADFIKFEDGIKLPFLDIKGAADKGLLKLVKKFRYNATSGAPEIELYDAQSAIVDILKIHGKFNNSAGSSEDKPFILKVVYGDQRANDPATPAAPESSEGH